MSSNLYPSPIIVGYRSALRDDYADLVPEPLPASNLVKPDAIERDIAKKLIAFREYAVTGTITGKLVAVYAVDVQNQSVFDSTTLSADDSIGAEFVRWVLSNHPTSFSHYPRSAFTFNLAAFYGFGVQEFIKLAAVEAVLNDVPIPLGFWQHNSDVHDPHHMLVSLQTRREQVTIHKIAKRCGMTLDEDYVPGNDVIKDTQVVWELCCRYGLVILESSGGVSDQLRNELLEKMQESLSAASKKKAEEKKAVESKPPKKVVKKKT